MKDLTDKLAADLFQGADKYLTSISVSNFKSNAPKVNFRRIKLNKFQDLCKDFKSKSITDFILDTNLLNLISPTSSEEQPSVSGELNYNPLRKKKIEEEIPIIIEELNEIIQNETKIETELPKDSPFLAFNNSLEEESELIELKEQVSKEPILKPKNETKKDITFNLEAETIQNNENILLSPSLPSSEVKENLISASGKQSSFVWPPVTKKKTAKKGKPYFLSIKEEDKSPTQKTESSQITEPKTESKKDDNLIFPWTSNTTDGPKTEENIGGGLESELLDIPSFSKKIESNKSIHPTEIPPIKESDTQTPQPKESTTNITSTFSGNVVYKALFPNIPFKPLSENIISYSEKNISWFNKLLDKFNNLEFGIVVTGKDKKKAGKMFEKFNYKLTPIRIIILGGAVATLGYSIWSYLLPIINSNFTSQENNKVVKDLFKSKHLHLGDKSKLLIQEKGKNLQASKLLEEDGFSPITEEERVALIQMARESLEGRVDPFGQEAVLPKEVIQQKLEEQKNTGPKEISIDRKQVELVGVISSNNKNLALVNVYGADYTITEDDDKATKDSKLKTALSMAVPNRLEVSLLDPIEDWYIKQIFKGKAKDEDPMIELVKGDKKFKLKVGQKVLLPEEKQLEDKVSEEDSSTDTDTSKE